MSLEFDSPDLSSFEDHFRRRMKAAASKMHEAISRRSISEFMRDAGLGAGRRSATDKGPLRIVSGRLARSLRGARTRGSSESVRKLDIRRRQATLQFGTRVPYGAVHEGGFSGTVTVRAHNRGGHSVRSHQRRMNIPKRAYLDPAGKRALPEIERIWLDDVLVPAFNDAART